MRLQNIRKKVNNRIKFTKYGKYRKQPLLKKAFLLEAGQGQHINGNVFAFVQIMETSEEWKDYMPYLVVTEKVKASAAKKLKQNGFSRTKLVIRDTDEYLKLLATAEFLVTDNSFPSYYVKREGQIYLNTWHGTPLKRLGRADILNSTSIGNVQKNFLAADYLLQPNQYTEDVMMEDYMVNRLYEGKTVVIDYPRNDNLFDDRRREEVRAEFGLEDKKVLAYMPTWRGVGRKANVKKHVADTVAILDYLEKQLADDEILYVNLHFLVNSTVDFSKYSKIRQFPAKYETYVFLAACDVLISDYSSVMIDFAQTGRDVIMYIYDFEEYSREKGFYFDIRTLPFRIAETLEQLTEEIHREPQSYELDPSLMGDHFGNATEKMMRLLCRGEEDGLKIRKWDNSKNTRLVHVGNLSNREDQYVTTQFISDLSEEEKKRTVITLENTLNARCLSYLKTVDKDVHFVRFVRANYSPISARAYDIQEKQRLLQGINPASMELLQSGKHQVAEMFADSDCHTVYHNVPAFLRRGMIPRFVRNSRSYVDFIGKFDEIVEYPENYCIDVWNENKMQSTGIIAYFRPTSVSADNEDIVIEGNIDISNLERDFSVENVISIARIEYPAEVKVNSEKFENRIYSKNLTIKARIKASETLSWHVNNKLVISVLIGGKTVKVKTRSVKKLIGRSRVFSLDRFGSVCCFDNRKRFYKIIVRDGNVTDRKKEKFKLAMAFLLSRITPWYRPVVLFEKDCARYEESASVLLEYLADISFRNARFILDRNYDHYDEIPQKCRKYLVDKFSFSHYYSIFAAKTLISSETLVHALEKRNTSKLFKDQVMEGTKNYIFLQHGVMYMVSLGSGQRSFFNIDVEQGNRRVVVSSALEAEHFKQYTRYEDKDIYITGLLKFDKSIMNEDADRITVMLTWRPWEYVSGINDLSSTGYYKMLSRIADSVPDTMKDKLTVLPHPLIAKQMLQMEDSSLQPYINDTEKYDDILKKTKLLITDYSSISYDAFYRGANVIFYWEEKDACMAEYGVGGRLMLTEDLAFGDVCMNGEELKKSVSARYNYPQEEEHIRNYRQIVEFHDGKNTERFVKLAKEDGLI